MKSIRMPIILTMFVSVTVLGCASQSNTPPSTSQVQEIDSQLLRGISMAFGERRGHVVVLEVDSGRVQANASINSPAAQSYAPGSAIKPFMALAGLELNKRHPEQRYDFGGYFSVGQNRFVDSRKGGHGLINLHQSLVLSSDTYYYALANDLGIEAIHDFLAKFGFGEKSGIALPDEAKGILPSPEWKRDRFKDKGDQFRRWYPSETISLGIGQGYLQATPQQLARATAALANGGKLYRPQISPAAIQKNLQRSIDLKITNLEIVQAAMRRTTTEGAAQSSFSDSGYSVAGKTGAAMVWTPGKNDEDSIQTDSSNDHSIFIGYAPVDRPKVAISVIVENGGPGHRTAAPIARAILDQILSGKPIQGRIAQLPEHDGEASD